MKKACCSQRLLFLINHLRSSVIPLFFLSLKKGSFFNASMKLKDKTDGQWQSITSFMPNIPSGQAVYFSRTFIDSVWLIKLTGTRYESEELGLASFKKQ